MARTRAIQEVPALPAEPQVTDQASGPRSTKRARTRERLIEAAKEIFEENGFLEARISDIAARAGQSHGTFYYHFKTKEEIFGEVAAAVDERLFAPMDEVIMAQTPLAPQQRIREAMRRHFEAYRKEARIMGLIEQFARHDPINALRLTRHDSYTKRAAETIRQLQRKKLADPKLDPMLTAAALGALTDRFAEMWLVHGAIECTLEHAVDQISRIFANSIRLKT